MFAEFQQTARSIFDGALARGSLLRNPGDEQLRALTLAEPGIVETKYGSLMVQSEPKSRAAMLTRNNIDDRFGEPERQLLRDAETRLAREELVSVDVQVGDGTEGTTARLIVPKGYAHIAYGGTKLLTPAVADDPTYQVVMFFDEAYETNKSKPLPKKEITIRLAHSPDGRMVKFVRNSNYFGEWKKGVFAGEDYRVKLRGDAIFLHAGCRKDTLETTQGTYVTNYSLFVALSANGKTSTTCKVLARKGRERSWLIQDDGGTLDCNGVFRGFEGGGLFIKTDALNPGEQREAYYACLKRDTFLENVWVEPDGSIDFYNMELTSNGRAVVQRRDFMHCNQNINAPRVNNLFIITRGSIIPAVARLTHEQAAAFMVLGQSQESSAGDPTQAGQLKNEFFYDPFLAGDRAEHANLFYDILKRNSHVNCYLLNTGWIGEGEHFRDINLGDTMGILDSLLRGGAQHWMISEGTRLPVPRSVRAVDSILMHPLKLYGHAEFERRQTTLDRQRAELIDQYPGLHPAVKAVFEP